MRWLQAALLAEHGNCIEWPFRVGTHGYGEFRTKDRHWLAHRWVCIQAHGTPPPEADAAHRCGNRICCNRWHVRWATRAENHFDKRAHGTHLFGEKSPDAILTEEQVRAIRAAPRHRGIGTALATQYDVHPNTIYAARGGRSWKHLP